MKPYKVPLCDMVTEFTEKKSRFISHISPVSSEKEALSFLDEIRSKHQEANHNVYAYHIKDGNFCRYNDDGEPSGTAGKPLLEVFNKQQVFDYCCVATRYFGGIPLGAGGLIRAYARCGAIVLEASGIGLVCEMTVCKTVIPYSLYEQAKRLFVSYEIEELYEDFAVEVKMQFSIMSDVLPKLQNNLTELTQGVVQISIEGTKLGMKRG